jgi:hypothetical protein
MLLGNPSEAQTSPAITHDRDSVDIERGSAYAAAIKLGSAHARADALDDQGPFQLCDRRDDHYDRASQWTVCVDGFALGKELDAEVVQFVEDLQEVLGTTGQPVARPHENDIKAMAGGVAQQPV